MSCSVSTRWIAVVAVAPNGVIGRDGDMPWSLSSDLRRFKRLTMGCPIVMGRKTFDSIGKPLPGRHNYVLTRQAPDKALKTAAGSNNLTVVHSVSELVEATKGVDRAYIIGGATIYGALMELTEEILLTRVWTQTAGDTCLSLPFDEFACELIERVPQGPKDSVPTEFQVWKRKRVDHVLPGVH